MKNINKIKPASLGKRRDKPIGIAEKVINLLKIINLIERGDCPTINRLAEELEVSDRSIYRYLNIINFIVPIVYDKHKGGYRFERPETLKVIPFNDKELALLAALADVTSQIGEPMKETFMEILSKVNFGTRGSEMNSPFINIKIPKSTTGGLDWFKTLTDAIIQKKQIHITYRSKNTKERTRRIVNPYKVIFSEGVWFLYGYCNLRKETRWFALDSIEALKVLDKTYEAPDEREIEERLQLAWGIRDGQKTEVTVRFNKEVSELINRKPSWHSTEKRKILETGEIELTFTVSGTEEIKWWIYSWIPYVKVIKPDSLREEVMKEVTKFMTEMSEKGG